MPGPGAPYSQLDADQVLRQAFDESTDSLRVKTEATVVAGAMEVAISAVDDSIRLGDGTNLTSVTASGELKVIDEDANTSLTSIDSKIQTANNQIKTQDIISSITRTVVSIGTSFVQVSPIANQKFIRIVPLVTGNFYWSPDNALTSSNSEPFSNTSAITITTSTSIFLLKETGSGNVVVYQGA